MKIRHHDYYSGGRDGLRASAPGRLPKRPLPTQDTSPTIFANAGGLTGTRLVGQRSFQALFVARKAAISTTKR
jgi:hypothetical protein